MISNAQAKLDYLFGTKAAIKLAIETKGVTVGEGVTFRQYAEKIGEIPTSGAGEVEFLVRFIDYDGTIIKEELVNDGEDATAPVLPTHNNLTFYEWNNEFTNVTHAIDVGATYSTIDGKSYVFITLTTPTGLTPTLYLAKFTADVMTINWGDGTSETTTTNGNIALAHPYALAGDFCITIECSGGYYFGQNSSLAKIFNGYDYILTKLFIGQNVTSLSDYSFANSYSLQNIVIPKGIISIGTSMFNNCYLLESLILPKGLISIGGSFCYSCYSLRNIVLSIGITTILSYAFRNCYSLISIVLPIGITNIGTYAFTGCYSLESAVLPNTITSIASQAFNSCSSLKHILLPTGLTIIESNVFQACYSLIEIVIPTGVTSIGNYAFDSCTILKTIVIPITVITIGTNAFGYCYALSSIVIPAGVTAIGNTAFAQCYALSSIVIPNGCIVGTDLLEQCYNIKTITIPEGNTIIGNDFAIDSKSLKTVYLPSTIVTIADDAFSNCQQLNTLELLATTPPTLHAGAFDVYSKILKIYVPDASVDAYKIATNWITLANYIHPISTKP
jgi:hypothetical protein